MRTNHTAVQKLYKLSKLEDYEVADKDPDIRNWNAYSADNVIIGKIDDLIVDTETMRAQYADMVVDKHYVTGVKDNHLLIPLEMIHIDKKNKKVLVAKIASKDLAIYPLYNGSEIPANYEQTLREKLMQGS